MQAGRQDRGDRAAMVDFEVRRFTWEEHEAGDAKGWRLLAGWFERASGLRWGWFTRDDKRQEK